MLLAIDIGNTNITIGVFPPTSHHSSENITAKSDGNKNPPYKQSAPSSMWRISSDSRRTADEYGTQILDFLHYSLINKEDISAVAISSVVPPLDEIINSACKIYLKKNPLLIDHTHLTASNTGIKINVDNPQEVGIDRLVNALAAHKLFPNRPAIVVDSGTALTFDCVSRNGEYLGGVILPGLHSQAEALARHTAKLPHVSIARPSRLIGKNTIECIRSGLWYSYIFTIKNFIGAMRLELGKNSIVIATGGDMAGIFSTEKKDIKEIDVFSPTLTLEGIKILWELTSSADTKKQPVTTRSKKQITEV